jgi:D-sedoheptulose 7-phosphate isomerase
MSFPDRSYCSAVTYVAACRDEITLAWKSLDLTALDWAAAVLDTAIRDGRRIYAWGSAAIANHLLCDVVKGVQTDTSLRPRVVSLTGRSPEHLSWL